MFLFKSSICFYRWFLSFNNEWEQKLEYKGFNIEIKDGLWISDIGSLYTFNAKEFSKNEISYQTLDGKTICK